MRHLPDPYAAVIEAPGTGCLTTQDNSAVAVEFLVDGVDGVVARYARS